MLIDQPWQRGVASVVGLLIVGAAIYAILCRGREDAAVVAVMGVGFAFVLVAAFGHRIIELSVSGVVLKLTQAAKQAEEEGDAESAEVIRGAANLVATGEMGAGRLVEGLRYERDVRQALQYLASKRDWEVLAEPEATDRGLDFLLRIGGNVIGIETKSGRWSPALIRSGVRAIRNAADQRSLAAGILLVNELFDPSVAARTEREVGDLDGPPIVVRGWTTARSALELGAVVDQVVRDARSAGTWID